MFKVLNASLLLSLLSFAGTSLAGPHFDQLRSDFNKVIGDTKGLLTTGSALTEMAEMRCRLLDSDDKVSDGGHLLKLGERFSIQAQQNGLVRFEGLTNVPVDFISTDSGALEASFHDESVEIQMAIRALREKDKMVVYMNTKAENLDVISVCEKP